MDGAAEAKLTLLLHVFFFQAEGGLGDILQLDFLLRALGFSQSKADAQV